MKATKSLLALLILLAPGFLVAAESINVWMISSPVPELIKAFDDAAVDFESASGIKVNYVRVPPGDFHTKLVTNISAKQYPDLVIWNIHPGVEFQATGAVLPMNDTIGAFGKSRFADAVLKSCEVGGKYWEIPYLSRPAGLHVRKDWMKEAGYDTKLYKDAKGRYYLKGLSTWEDYLALAKKMTDKSRDRYGMGFQMSRKGFGDSAGFALAVLFSYGGSLLDPNGKIAINSPEAVDAFAFIKKVWDSGVMPASTTTWDGNGNNNYFIGGEIGMVYNSNSILTKLSAKTAAKPEDVMIVPFPTGPKGLSYMYSNPETITIFKTPHSEAAKKYALYLLDTKTQVAMFKTMKFGYYSPLRADVMADPLFDSLTDNDKVFMQDSSKIVDPSYPAEPNGKLSALINAFVMDDALSRIAVDGWSPQQVVKEIEQKENDALND